MKSVLLREDQVNSILSGALKLPPRDHLIIQLSYYCAMSPSEVIHLRVEAFDEESGKITIYPSHGTKHFKWACQIPRDIVRGFKGYMSGKRAGWLFGSRGRSCEIPGCPGGHISRKHIQNTFISILEKSGVPRCGIHSLRHTRLHEIGEITRDPGMIQEIGRISSDRLCRKYAGVKTTRKTKEQGEKDVKRKEEV